jgi:hypothetical protein
MDMVLYMEVGLSKTGRRGPARVRGKSELHRAECWLTASGGNLKESATETYRLTTTYMGGHSLFGAG